MYLLESARAWIVAGGVCVHWVVITEARSRYALGWGDGGRDGRWRRTAPCNAT